MPNYLGRLPLEMIRWIISFAYGEPLLSLSMVGTIDFSARLLPSRGAVGCDWL
jgi:hypothetical protein